MPGAEVVLVACFLSGSDLIQYILPRIGGGFSHFDGGAWRKRREVPRNFWIVPRNDFILPRFLVRTAAECAPWVAQDCAATPVPDGDSGVLGRILY